MATPGQRNRAQVIDAMKAVAEAETNDSKKKFLRAIIAAAEQRRWRSGAAGGGYYVIEPSSTGLIVMVGTAILLGWVDDLCQRAKINNFRPYMRPAERELSLPSE